MPIYEFACEACGRESSVFQRSMNVAVSATCPHCQSGRLRRLISRFAVLRSTNDAFDDSDLAGLDSDDPEAMERWARGMGAEAGGDFGDAGEGGDFDGTGDEFDD